MFSFSVHFSNVPLDLFWFSKPALSFLSFPSLSISRLGSTMGSEEEFKACVSFIEKHKIVPSIDTVLNGLDEAHKGFALLQDAEKRSAGKVIVEISKIENAKARL